MKMSLSLQIKEEKKVKETKKQTTNPWEVTTIN
jgi:hypothetical protein